MFGHHFFHLFFPILFEVFMTNFKFLAKVSDEILVLSTHHLLEGVLDDVVVGVVGKFGGSFFFHKWGGFCIS